VYKRQTVRFIIRNAWIKTKAFLYEAGTFILATSIVIWFLLHFPIGVKKPEDSLFGKISHTIAPVFYPLGFGNWEAAGSLISGFVAKEVVLSTMGNIYSGEIVEEKPEEVKLSEGLLEIGKGFINANIDMGKNFLSIFGLYKMEAEEEEEDSSLIKAVRDSFTPLTAISFLVFLLLYTPCMATVFAIKQELNSWRWTGVSILISFTSAWIMAFIVYNAGKIIAGG